MKKLDKFIIKAFLGPFFGILAVVVFIFVLQFLWVYIDELVGKGLGIRIILEFLLWGSCTMLPVSLPLATLLASVMTIGQMGENNELIAMKAAGISLTRIIAPLAVVAVLISVGTFFAANDLVPVAFNEIYTLREDIGRTKEEIKIPTGTFYDGIDGYVLRVQDRDKESGMMYNVMVYDHTGEKGNTSITIADSATMSMSQGKDYLIFRLMSGVNYQETNEMHYKDTTLQLQRILFTSQEMVIPLENYSFQKSKKARYDDQPKSMNLTRLRHGTDSANHARDSLFQARLAEGRERQILRYNSQLDTAREAAIKSRLPLKRDWESHTRHKAAIQAAMEVSKECVTTMRNYSNDEYQYVWLLRRTTLEAYKKFAEALACLLLFFIGAPLGAFLRKGGLGVSAIIAVLFFVLYWVVDITGTKLARDGAVNSLMGAFISAAVLAPIGFYLTRKAVQDAKLFNMENFGTWWRRTKSKITSMFRKTRIVYMGTPEFAVAPLDALIKAKYNVVGVVTVADKPSGRGLKVNESAVKKYAVEHNLPVLQPLKLKDPEFLSQLAAFKADLFVVVAFRMLPEEVWTMPKLGTINLHAALLPQYRGAAPINWAVINGESLSGVTTFMIDKDIDTGGIILRQECRIGPDETAGEFHDRLMPIGAQLVVETVEGLIERSVETRVQRSFIQGSEVLKSAPKLTRELLHIDWSGSTKAVYNLIRGLSPYPAAFTEIVREGAAPLQMKIYSARPVTGEAYAQMLSACGIEAAPAPGTLLSDGKNFLAISTADGAVNILELQLQGKKRMEVKPFLLGFREPMAWATTKGTSFAAFPARQQQ